MHNSVPVYINTEFIHFLTLFKQLPTSVNHRLSVNFCYRKIIPKGQYETAL